MNSTGENEQGLRKILDWTRLASLLVLGLHCYYYCYAAFQQWELTTVITDRLLQNIMDTGLFGHAYYSKGLSLALLGISLLGAKGRKDEKIRLQPVVTGLVVGSIIYFFCDELVQFTASYQTVALVYMIAVGVGYLLVLGYGTQLSRLIKVKLSGDIFNDLNESFPQEERFLSNEFSINLPARYRLKGKLRRSWINIINPFRGTLVMGSPGSGKSFFVIQRVIKQHIEKGFALFVYDFKFDDLTRIAYNWQLRCRDRYATKPSFYVINFDDLSHSHRCNPLEPSYMHDITDASESARTILLGLNREWITKQGAFFVESPINFLTAVIWFLRKYEGGRYCTLPHVIELMQRDYEELFAVLNTEPEIEVLVNPFISAYQNNAMEQLEGQVASAKIGMARLASPQLYWVLSGSDFTLDINNPKDPKIVCMGNNPEKQQIYGAVLSLYVSRLVRQVNKKDRLKCSLVFDEFPTIFFNHMDSLIATARSNKVATTLGIQDFSQLKKEYGKDGADVIMNITGNVISGQVMGETARGLSERFGKIMQDRESISINRMDMSISRSRQLDFAVPASKIASLSSGEFVGMVADDPHEKIKRKVFHGEILQDTEKLQRELKGYKPLPVVSNVTPQQILDNYHQVKLDIKKLVAGEVEKLKVIKA
jgi:hypothetical protein